jgi:hypothetical protein
MNAFLARVALDWPKTLTQVLARASAQGEKGVLIFDLDSTVFDNRPRQARILREYGAQAGLKPLEACQAFHVTDGWNLLGAMVTLGLSEADAQAQLKPFRKFWGARFFTSAYCEDDIEVVGAPRFLAACVATGAQVAYVTGRYEEMRPGTLLAMTRCGLPLPGGKVSLVMKPRLRDSDDEFKRTAHAGLAAQGMVVAAFDNEPIHANDYARRFPEALVVHLATDDSGREKTLLPGVVSIPHFAW